MSDIQPASLPLYAGWVVPGTTAAEQRAYIERLICQRSGDVVVAWLASEVERLRDALVQERMDNTPMSPMSDEQIEAWREEVRAELLREGKL